MSAIGDFFSFWDRIKGWVVLFLVFVFHGIVYFLGFDSVPFYKTLCTDEALNTMLFAAIFAFCGFVLTVFIAIHNQRVYGNSFFKEISCITF